MLNWPSGAPPSLAGHINDSADQGQAGLFVDERWCGEDATGKLPQGVTLLKITDDTLHHLAIGRTAQHQPGGTVLLPISCASYVGEEPGFATICLRPS